MRNRTVIAVLAMLVAVMFACSSYAAETKKAAAAKPAATKKAPSAAKPAPAKPAPTSAAAAKEFNQKKVLDDLWKAPDSTVVGTVNGAKVTKGELMKALWQWQAPTTLQDLLNQKMIEQAANKSGVKLTPAELNAKMDESLKRMNMSSVDQLLNQFKVTWYRFQSGTKVSALAEKTVQKQVKVSPGEYADYIKARHILVKFPTDETDVAKKEAVAKTKIEEIQAKVKAGEDFAKLADEYSDDPGNMRDGQKQGGDLGWFSKGRMVQEFENAAFGLKAGEVSEPVKTFYGYHLIKVEKTGKDAVAADKAELNKMILEKKIPQEMSKWFTDLQANSKIDNKLMGPQPKQPAPVRPQQPRVTPPTTTTPKVTPKVTPPPTPAPAPKPAEPPSSEKPETPPPPPPPPPAQ